MKINQIKMVVKTMENFAFNVLFLSTNKAFHFGGPNTEIHFIPITTAIFYLTYDQAISYYNTIQEYGDEAMKSLFTFEIYNVINVAGEISDFTFEI